jgi:hypothetical protein
MFVDVVKKIFIKTGMPIAEARYSIENLGIFVESLTEGTIIRAIKIKLDKTII